MKPSQEEESELMQKEANELAQEKADVQDLRIQAIRKLRPVYHDVIQQTDEWFELKLERISGTDASTLLTSKHKWNVGSHTLAIEKASEVLTGQSSKNQFSSRSTDRGNEYEPLARRKYTDVYFQDVVESGFVSLGEHRGASLDGLVGEDGTIEIKCPEQKEYLRLLDLFIKANGSQKKLLELISKGYMAQMQYGLMVTGRKWCDNFYFNPDFPMDCFNIRVKRDADMINIFEVKTDMVVMEIERLVASVRKAA